MNDPYNPNPWILAVFGVGVLGSAFGAGAYAAINAGIHAVIQTDPKTLIGTFLPLGMLGAFTGGIAGFATKLVLERWTASRKSWWAALSASLLAAIGVGLAVAALIARIPLGGE